MSDPGIAAFMPVLNEERRIRRAISSLQRQTCSVSTLVIVDGGSTDATLEAIEAIRPEVDFDIDVHVLSGAGVRYSSQFGAERAIERLPGREGAVDGIVVRIEGDSALDERFIETAVACLDDDAYSVFGAPVRPHDPGHNPVRKRIFTVIQNAEMLPKGRGMAFRAQDFLDVDGYRMYPDEDIQSSEIDCLEDGIIVSKLQKLGPVAFSRDTCVYSTVPSTSATSPDRWWTAAKIEREMGPTHYFTRIANPVNKLLYAGRRVVELV